MKREQSGPFLSAVFVDYDNIYLSLKRKSDEAAKRFAKDATLWLKQIENGALITPTNGIAPKAVRRIVMNRCYGNPVPRRNASDNSTDMSSFPFVRHHFLRAGFEVVDCPPLTAQLKNSSDIRMVMDLRDYLVHETHFDEFVILSGDADFTPVLHRLRAHARRTVIFATDYTAAPYTAICDGEVREADLITLLLEGGIGADKDVAEIAAPSNASGIDATRRAIIDDVVTAVRGSASPVPLEVLADRAVRAIGHERTIGTGWGGAGGFRELLQQALPQGLRLSSEAPYLVIDTQRHVAQHAPAQRLQPAAPAIEQAEPAIERAAIARPRDLDADTDAFAGLAALRAKAQQMGQSVAPWRQITDNHAATVATTALRSEVALKPAQPHHQPQPAQAAQAAPQQPAAATVTPSIQQSIARIHDACKAPPLAPPEYRALFELIAQEINENGLIGAQTIQNIVMRAQELGIDIRRDDVRFVIEVVSEADPWFEQGASANLFAGRFRNFVVARCRSQGLTLSADELDLIEAWFAGGTQSPPAARPAAPPPTFAAAPPKRAATAAADTNFWASEVGEGRGRGEAVRQADPADGDDFPRIVRTRLRG